MRINRCAVRLVRHANGVYQFKPNIISGVDVRPPIGRSTMLEIEINGAKVTRVRWGGEDLIGLASSQCNGMFTPQDYKGDFGVLARVSDVEFEGGFITFHGEDFGPSP